jgi:hypothetical protein
LRIEFSPELLHEVRSTGTEAVRNFPLRWIPRLNRVVTQSTGLLFGIRHASEVRVLEARAGEHPDGLAPVGIFVCRERGEVFLTEDDLANFERHKGVLALVIAGGRAGFFVREADGSVQAIRSHEEFRMADAAVRAVPETTGAADLPAPIPRSWYAWKRAVACVVLLAVPAVALAYFEPRLPRLPISLTLREESGQLVIGWNASALKEGGRLEIRDGSDRTILPLRAHTSSATYGLRGGDIEVRLSTGTRTGGAQWEASRFITRMAVKPVHGTAAASSLLQDRISALTREAEDLRRSLVEREAQTKKLAANVDAATREP